MNARKRFYTVFLWTITLLLLASMGCTLSLFSPPDGNPVTDTPMPPTASAPTATPVALSEVTFNASLPAPLSTGETLTLVLVDEVTGLALNARPYAMTAQDATHYTVTLPLPLGEVIKYRYARLGAATVFEDDYSGHLVRYRMTRVDGPGTVEDIISSWSDQAFESPTGSIHGQITDGANGKPLADVLVQAGGIQTVTDSLGQFRIEGLPPGTHLLTALDMDGDHDFFQQGAVVAANAITDVPIRLTPRPMVSITFHVTPPQDSVQGAPLRLAGDLLQLGNTFGDLQGGLNTLASAMPVMTQQDDGSYLITLQLPAGAGIHYKYTLGDGFWNAEHDADGAFVTRFLRVPPQNITVEDHIVTWQSGPNAPILFDVTVPDNTPAEDIIYLQLNPYGWMAPIPMWPMGGHRWTYKLYGPFNLVGNFGYRYCRNAQCGFADDNDTAGASPSHPRIAKTSIVSQHLTDTINRWAWYETLNTQLTAKPISPMAPGFIAGIEFLPKYDPSWQAHISTAINNVSAINANWLVMTPTWSVHNTQPLAFGIQPGNDALTAVNIENIQRARAIGLNVAVFPQPNLPAPTPNWWIDAPRTPEWWQAWFDAYKDFALHHAELARQANAQVLILGGEWTEPALSGGTLANGESANAPADADARWRDIIAAARERFGGPVFWALPYYGSLDAPPAFLDSVDGVYLLWDAPLSRAAAPESNDLIVETVRQLDEIVKPFSDTFGKPIIIAPAYPSAEGAANGCVDDGQGHCLTWDLLSPPHADVRSVNRDMNLQAEIYEAMLIAINQRPWVGGFIARGYYPPAILLDKSASVHGKPAADVFWYWYPRLTGKITP